MPYPRAARKLSGGSVQDSDTAFLNLNYLKCKSKINHILYQNENPYFIILSILHKSAT